MRHKRKNQPQSKDPFQLNQLTGLARNFPHNGRENALQGLALHQIKGILRLRENFASRHSHAAQDDNSGVVYTIF